MTCWNCSVPPELRSYEDGGPLQWNRKWETISRPTFLKTLKEGCSSSIILAPSNVMPSPSQYSNCSIFVTRSLRSCEIIKSYHLGNFVWAHRNPCCPYWYLSSAWIENKCKRMLNREVCKNMMSVCTSDQVIYACRNPMTYVLTLSCLVLICDLMLNSSL